MSQSPQDVYARYLLSSRGYPLWIPEPSHHILIHRPDGLRIGDVGVVVPEDGGFDVFFNICLPREHPFHRATGVPDDFEHITLRDEDIRVTPNMEPPGRIISTSSVTKITVEPSSDTPGTQPGGLGYEFELSSNGGALLILPEGAQRYDLRNRRLFFDEATKHGADWYRFAEQNLGQMISHDSLYLITGFHKARSWSVAAFESTAGSGGFSAQFKMAQVGGGNIARAYTWETTRSLDWRVGPVEHYGIPNQSVFIRGFKIALRESFLGNPRIKVEVGVPDARLGREGSFNVVRRYPWISKVWKGLSRSGHHGIDAHDDAATGDWVDDHSLRSGPSSDAGKHVVIQPVPEPSQIFHPSDIINQYLLGKENSAHVAVTHDDDWAVIFEKGYTKPEGLMRVNSSRVEAIIPNIFNVVSQEGAVFLQTKGLVFLRSEINGRVTTYTSSSVDEGDATDPGQDEDQDMENEISDPSSAMGIPPPPAPLYNLSHLPSFDMEVDEFYPTETASTSGSIPSAGSADHDLLAPDVGSTSFNIESNVEWGPELVHSSQMSTGQPPATGYDGYIPLPFGFTTDNKNICRWWLPSGALCNQLCGDFNDLMIHLGGSHGVRGAAGDRLDCRWWMSSGVCGEHIRRDGFRRHIGTHLRRISTCSECGKTYSRADALRAHMKKVHGDK